MKQKEPTLKQLVALQKKEQKTYENYLRIYNKLAKQVERDWGKKCDVYSFGCSVCNAWLVVGGVKELVVFANPKNWKKIK
jgi:hypothetical protein